MEIGGVGFHYGCREAAKIAKTYNCKQMLMQSEFRVSNCLRPPRHRAHWYYWSTGGLQRSVTSLYCVWSCVAQKWRKTRRNAGFFCIFFSTLFGRYGVETSPKSGPKAPKKRQKWRPGVVLGALGGAPGGIWAPRRPKAEKSSKK